MEKPKEAPPKKPFGEGPDFPKALEEIQKFRTKYATNEAVPDSDIPIEFDLSDVMGFDFTGKVRDQSSCGSCYTMGFIQTLESRLKMLTGKDPGALSPQHIMQCNYLTEGCTGGWAIFDGYLAENGGVVSEECAPYLGVTRGHSCSEFSGCPSVASVNKSYAIHDATENQIKKEILRNGMLVTDWYMPPYTKTYKSGIFSKAGDDDLMNLMGANLIPNHASVIMGWGQEDISAKKYWIVRNSFGQEFGINGNIHIEMGEFMVSGYVAGFEPVLTGKQ